MRAASTIPDTEGLQLGAGSRWPTRTVTVVAVAVPAAVAGLFGFAVASALGRRHGGQLGVPTWSGWAVWFGSALVLGVVFGLGVWRSPGTRCSTATDDLVRIAITGLAVTGLAVTGLMCCLADAGVPS